MERLVLRRAYWHSMRELVGVNSWYIKCWCYYIFVTTSSCWLQSSSSSTTLSRRRCSPWRPKLAPPRSHHQVIDCCGDFRRAMADGGRNIVATIASVNRYDAYSTSSLPRSELYSPIYLQPLDEEYIRKHNLLCHNNFKYRPLVCSIQWLRDEIRTTSTIG